MKNRYAINRYELYAIRHTNNDLLEIIHGGLDLIARPYDTKKVIDKYDTY